MSQVFKVEQADILFQAYLSEPAFGMLRDLPALLDRLFRRLEWLRPRAADAKLESSNDGLGHVHLGLPLMGGFARVFVDRIEIQSSFVLSRQQNHDDATVDILETLAEYLPEVSWKAFTSTLSLHGAIPGGTAGEFLSRFSAQNAPRSLGPLLGTGVVFYYGADEGRLASSLTLDFSPAVEQGVLLKLRVLQDATGTSPQDAPRVFRSQSAKLFSELEIALES